MLKPSVFTFLREASGFADKENDLCGFGASSEDKPLPTVVAEGAL